MRNSYKYLTHSSKRTIVIGDIHGCYDEFIQLLETIEFTDLDLLITVGDMVDRGPKSIEVARYFRDTPNAFAVLGNHERRLSGAMKGTIQPAWSQLHTMMQIPEDESNQWIHFFDSLPAVIETPDVIVTHARIDPLLPLKDQDPYYTCAVGGLNAVIETDKNGIPLWYYQWIERAKDSKPVCFGHLTFPKVELVSQKLFALDEGVAGGGRLNAVILPEGTIVQVKSGTDHYTVSYNHFMTFKFDHIEPENLKISKYFSMIKKEKLHPSEERLVKRFEVCLNSLDLQSKFHCMKENIHQAFGMPPSNGSLRGDYFISLREELTGTNTRLLSFILNDKPLNTEALLKLSMKKNLKQLLSEIDQLGKRIITQDNL